MKNAPNDLAPSGYVLSGWGAPSALSPGFATVRSLVVFGELYETQVRNPSGDSQITDLEWQGLGPGMKYYVAPENIFVSSSLLLSRLAIHNRNPGDERYGINRTSRWGVTGRFSVGKEWWASCNWGLGFADEFVLGRRAGADAWGPYPIGGVSLLATASFN